MIRIICSIISMIFFLGINSFAAEEKHPAKVMTVTAYGEIEADAQDAKQKAIADALRNAVMKGIGAYVESETLGSNFQVIKDNILLKASGFATLEKVESTSVANDILRVKITASVSSIPLLEKLKALGLTHEWKIGVYLPESYISKPKPIPDPAAETEIIKSLLKAGFSVLDDSQRKKLMSDESARRAIDGDKTALADLAREYDVDIFITGEAFAEYVDELASGGITQYRAKGRIEAKAFYTDTAELISMTDAFASGIDETESLSAKQCFKKLGAEVSKTLTEDILVAPASLNPFVSVKILGIKGAKAKQQLTDAVRTLRGVTKVKQQRQTTTTLELNVYIKEEYRDEFAASLESCPIAEKMDIVIDFCSKSYVQGRAQKTLAKIDPKLVQISKGR